MQAEVGADATVKKTLAATTASRTLMGDMRLPLDRRCDGSLADQPAAAQRRRRTVGEGHCRHAALPSVLQAQAASTAAAQPEAPGIPLKATASPCTTSLAGPSRRVAIGACRERDNTL